MFDPHIPRHMNYCHVVLCVVEYRGNLMCTNLELELTAGVSIFPMAAGALALIRISIPPNVSTVLSTAACTWFSSRTSTVHGRHRPPAASTIAQKRRKCIFTPLQVQYCMCLPWIVSSRLQGSVAEVFAAISTLAPSRAAFTAMALPMP